MLVGLTLTTEIFLASFSLASSCLSSSFANMAAAAQDEGTSVSRTGPPNETPDVGLPAAEFSSLFSPGDVWYTRGSTKGVKDALDPPTPNCRDGSGEKVHAVQTTEVSFYSNAVLRTLRCWSDLGNVAQFMQGRCGRG